jgi:hypothetical protein
LHQENKDKKSIERLTSAYVIDFIERIDNTFLTPIQRNVVDIMKKNWQGLD